MMRYGDRVWRRLRLLPGALVGVVLSASLWTSCQDQGGQQQIGSTEAALATTEDPLIRMPGTQPDDGVTLESPGRCLNCHAGYNSQVEPGHNWKGSMMAQSTRDFIFWACFTVSAQDSMWAVGRPAATDLCERCHFPKGWIEGRSDPTNASAMVGADFDGVQCDFCHRMYDPFFQTTHDGTREGNDWAGYWDESNASSTPSQPAAAATYQEDIALAQGVLLFNGNPFFGTNNLPVNTGYSENGSGQFFIAAASDKRASFADAAARHQMLYARHHKSKYFCNSCHDVSNPVLANLQHKDATRFDGATVLPTEKASAATYFHVERTFSEFTLSAYGQPGGAPGVGPFAATSFKTSNPNNVIARCQDCHMRDVSGAGCNKNGVPVRPGDSTEHSKSGQPLHDLTGGNIFVATVLASAVAGSSNYDATNAQLLGQGAAVLTLDLTQGEGIDPKALLDGAARARQQLELAASIQQLSYDATTGALSFKVQNHTGHKLISGFPEGRRMFVNVRAFKGGQLIHEVNPYDAGVGTLKGLPAAHSPSSPALTANESHVDDLVYEMQPSSTLTEETKTFHFALATGRYKDNRIPPKGFQIAQAAARLTEPVIKGVAKLDHFTADEYAGGHDAVSLSLPAGADRVEVRLYYQTTSREYIEFLRNEIKGPPAKVTLPQTAYVAQTDPFFAKLKAWGETIWQLWDHNKNLPGAAPVLMAEAAFGQGSTGACGAPVPTLNAATPDNKQITLAWSDVHSSDAKVTGYRVYYDQAGKAQLVAETGKTTTHVDTGLTNGQQYCYKVTSIYGGESCESDFSQVRCATPGVQGSAQAGVGTLDSGLLQTTGKGKNAVASFTIQGTFAAGDEVTLKGTIGDASTGQPIVGATFDVKISGPETTTLTSTASDDTGVAYATWKTSSPNKRGTGGTAPGSYTATVTGVAAGNTLTWDEVATSATFSLE